MQIIVDSLLTRYSKKGSGKQTILLIHGWGDSGQTFDDLSKELSKKYTVIELDLPGNGQSQIPNDVWNLDTYAKFIHNFLKKLKINDLYAVVGHSNGAALSIRAIALGAIKPKKLIILAGAGIRDRQKVKRLLLKIVAKIGKVLTFWLPSSTRKKLQEKLYGAAGSDMLVVPQLQETFKITVRQDVQKDARQLKLPTLLIYGSEDKATPPLFGRIYNKLINGSKLLVIDGAAHFIHHEKLAQVNTKIKDFLK